MRIFAILICELYAYMRWMHMFSSLVFLGIYLNLLVVSLITYFLILYSIYLNVNNLLTTYEYVDFSNYEI